MSNFFFLSHFRNAAETACYLLMLKEKNEPAKWQTDDINFWQSFASFESMFPSKRQILTYHCSSHYLNSSREGKAETLQAGSLSISSDTLMY